jgi:hypothetical protein
MNLRNDQELINTERKLALLEERIEAAKARPRSDANTTSLRSLVQMANQLREEIVRYRSQQTRRAS